MSAAPPSSKASAEALAEFSILKGVTLAAREDLIERAEVRSISPGEFLIRQGAANSTMYLLLSGSLSVYLDDLEGEALTTIDAGQTVGEMSILDGQRASASVVADSSCTLLVVDERVFWHLIEGSHAFSVQLLSLLAHRLRANNETVGVSAKERAEFERASLFDSLTGLHNRRWLDQTLERMTGRHRRDCAPFSIAVIDVDHFKRFNDEHGHEAGDLVLKVVAEGLLGSVRPTDLVARFGGEEFIVLFPQTSAQLAEIACERVRKVIAEQSYTMPDGIELPRVTISIGVAQLGSEQSEAELLRAADQAMYTAKAQGRDRVCCAPAAAN